MFIAAPYSISAPFGKMHNFWRYQIELEIMIMKGRNYGNRCIKIVTWNEPNLGGIINNYKSCVLLKKFISLSTKYVTLWVTSSGVRSVSHIVVSVTRASQPAEWEIIIVPVLSLSSLVYLLIIGILKNYTFTKLSLDTSSILLLSQRGWIR